MEYLSYILKTSTNFVNKNNLFNFFITIINNKNESERKDFIVCMRLNMGLTFTNEFKNYIFRKMPKSKLLSYFI